MGPILQSAASPTGSSTASPVEAVRTKKGLTGGTIAGIVVADLAVLAVGVLWLWFLHRRRLNESRASLPNRSTAAHSQMVVAPTDSDIRGMPV